MLTARAVIWDSTVCKQYNSILGYGGNYSEKKISLAPGIFNHGGCPSWIQSLSIASK